MCVIACSTVHSFFFFFKDLLMYFSFVLAKLHGMWDVTSLIRDRNCIPSSGVLTAGPPREVPQPLFLTLPLLSLGTAGTWLYPPGPCSVTCKSVIRQGQLSPGSTIRTPVRTTAVQGWYLANWGLFLH